MKAAFAGVLLTTAVTYGAADPQLVGLMMPDAKVVAGFQLAESQSTPFGQFLMKQIPADAGLDNFVSATGFDPRQDLHEVVAASAGDNRWLIAGKGAFYARRTAGLAELAGATVTSYKGMDLITGNPDSPKANRAKGDAVNGIAFLDSTTVLIGEVPVLKSAIDRRLAGTAFNGGLAAKARDVSARNQAWIATSGAVQDLAPGFSGAQPPPVPMANLLQAITGLTVGVRLGSTNVTLTSEAATRSIQDAQALVDVLHFVMSMAQANRNDPRGGGAAALADAASITTSGSLVRLSLTVPESQLEQLFPPKPGLKKISNPIR